MKAIIAAAALWSSTKAAFASSLQAGVKPDPAQEAAIKKLEQAGAAVRPIAQNDNRLEISFLGYGTAPGQDEKDAKPTIDQALAPIREIKNIVYVRLGRTDLTDAGMAHLAGLTGVTRLNLEQTKITDAGLAHLKGMADLEYLNLYGTAVTDKGLAHLKGLEKLKNLYLWESKVTESGVAQLGKDLPGASINWQRDETAAAAPPKPAEAKKDP